ncbi:hypothetical protein [Legionella fallonii]|uniref:Phasin domain-containing protein n=1 Tax=Legionella fallonii LLAP-10 TaxID=1212491 RepID=A0A098G7V1_9GAMM|nr:hypothetical protein [Legionella fallonii]CEG58532.1 conserved protein of unknown function [Legionella fallonii LLAP-10]
MNQQYFSQKMFNTLEKPIQELMELHMKTFQNFSYITPVELFNVLKPEEILERNIEIMVKNGHKTLDYMHNLFSFMEKNWLNMSDKMMANAQQAVKETSLVTQKNMKKATSTAQRTVKKVTSAMKDATQKTAKKTEAVARKSKQEATKIMKQATKTAAKATKTVAKATKAASSVAKSVAKPSTTKSKVSASKVAASGSPTKRDVKNAPSSMMEKPNTMNKVEAKIHDTRQVNPLSVPTVTKDLDPNKKDRPLM